MLSTLLGTLFGGLFRFAPEVLKFFERRDDRRHELAMLDKQMEADRLRGQLAAQQAEAALGVEELRAIIEATRAQSVQSGIGWVDAINSLMRPLITFWWVIVLYTVYLICGYASLLQSGVSGLDAALAVFGNEEKAIVASIISFWFVDRSLRRGALK